MKRSKLYFNTIFTIKVYAGIACFMLLANGLSAQSFVDNATGEVVPSISLDDSYQLEFSDEFNDTDVNTAKWTVLTSDKSRSARPNIGINDWWWKPDNVWEEEGNLVLEVKKHDANTMYCGSVSSIGKYERMYGYYEARIKIADASKGTHTAFWFHGHPEGVDGTANDGAEIDVFESAWLEDYTKSVIHIDGYGADHQANTVKYTTPGIHEGYHVWGFHWTEKFMKIYYDGVFKVSYSADKWIVKAPEYIWLSDGASFGLEGDEYFVNQPIGTLTHAYVDYVRVWRINTDSVTPDLNESLLINGDFEFIDAGGWTLNNNDIKMPEKTLPVDSLGSNYTRFPGLTNGRFITQTVEVEPGAMYSFAFSGRIQNAVGISGSQVNDKEGYGVATLSYEVLDSVGNVLSSIATQSAVNTSVNGLVTIPEGVTSVTVKISKNWNVAYVDNVLFTKLINTSIQKAEMDGINVTVSHQNGLLALRSNEAIAKVQVYTLNGRMLRTKNTNNANNCTLNIGNQPRGMYIVKAVTANNKTVVRKVCLK